MSIIHNVQRGNIDGPEFYVQDFQPPTITSIFDRISAHVPQQLKTKIWQGQFIDLSVLLKSARELNELADMQGQIQIRNGTMWLVKQKSNSFLSIDT